MRDIIERVETYRTEAIFEAKAHLVAAEGHRKDDMVYGVASIGLSTLVSTSIFVALSHRFTLGGDANSTFWHLSFAFIVAAMLLISPVLTSIYKFMHNAQDSASHNTTAARYGRLVRQYDLFLMEFADADPSKRDQAIKTLRELDALYTAARENSITLDDKAKSIAKKLLNDCLNGAAPHPAAQTRPRRDQRDP